MSYKNFIIYYKEDICIHGTADLTTLYKQNPDIDYRLGLNTTKKFPHNPYEKKSKLYNKFEAIKKELKEDKQRLILWLDELRDGSGVILFKNFEVYIL